MNKKISFSSLGLLGLSLLLIGLGTIWRSRAARGTPSSAPTAGAVALASGASTPSADSKPAPVLASVMSDAHADLLAVSRDPFESPFDREDAAVKPAIRQVKPEDRVRVEGIALLGPNARQAIINGQVVGEGSVVNGVKVKSVGKTAIVFEYKGRSFSKSIPKPQGSARIW